MSLDQSAAAAMNRSVLQLGFPLRDDCDIFLRLPEDLTRREGNRLAAIVKSPVHYDH